MGGATWETSPVAGLVKSAPIDMDMDIDGESGSGLWHRDYRELKALFPSTTDFLKPVYKTQPDVWRRLIAVVDLMALSDVEMPSGDDPELLAVCLVDILLLYVMPKEPRSQCEVVIHAFNDLCRGTGIRFNLDDALRSLRHVPN